MHHDPTQYMLHDALIEAIDYDLETQCLIVSMEYNFALAVRFDPDSMIDDFRQTRLIFTGVQSINSSLPLFSPKVNDYLSCYADVLEFNWNLQADYPSVRLLMIFFDPIEHTEQYIETIIQYQAVEWQIGQLTGDK